MAKSRKIVDYSVVYFFSENFTYILVDFISNIMTQIKLKKCAWSDMVRSIHDPLEYLLTVLLLAQIL